ncbi:hypothetical protein JB92DRAFT_2831668 [Gautieria morchelliformis]|nr:hypothetical protein JB92DRAFT_2831668 [Gautieria morchelliformis]
MIDDSGCCMLLQCLNVLQAWGFNLSGPRDVLDAEEAIMAPGTCTSAACASAPTGSSLSQQQKIKQIRAQDEAGVTSIMISWDGQLVAAGSLDTIVCLWDVQSRQLIPLPRGAQQRFKASLVVILWHSSQDILVRKDDGEGSRSGGGERDPTEGVVGAKKGGAIGVQDQMEIVESGVTEDSEDMSGLIIEECMEILKTLDGVLVIVPSEERGGITGEGDTGGGITNGGIIAAVQNLESETSIESEGWRNEKPINC